MLVDEVPLGLEPAVELRLGEKRAGQLQYLVGPAQLIVLALQLLQRCVVPAEAIFEPSYETGNAVRWRIWRPGEVPMGVAGIWTSWRDPADREEHFSFAMLTVNAAGHPVMQRFHGPQDKKRMVVILDPKNYDEWLTCSMDEAPRYFRQWMGTLETAPAPLPPRARRPRGRARRRQSCRTSRTSSNSSERICHTQLGGLRRCAKAVVATAACRGSPVLAKKGNLPAHCRVAWLFLLSGLIHAFALTYRRRPVAAADL